MGLSIAQIERSPSADMNIVVSLSGLDTAEYIQQKYGIPFVCVMPLGSGQNLKDKINGTEKLTAVHDGKKVLIIHEQVFSNSLRECAEKIGSSQITVGSMLDLDSRLSRDGDLDLPDEKSVRNAVNSGEYSLVCGDPEIKKLIKRDDVDFLPLPHAAVSSKLHWNEYPCYIGGEMENIIRRIANP